MQGLLSLYSWRYPVVLVYMLQSVEYRAGPYLAWYWRTQNFDKVMQRRTLQHTRAARLLLGALRVGILAQMALGLWLILWWQGGDFTGGWAFGLAMLLAAPVTWAQLVVVPLVLGRWLLVAPRERRLVRQAEHIFRKHPGAKLAIVGSYGKTSMKELLVAVLGEGKKVAATPGNKNVPVSHARFAQKLHGDEDIVIIEYGEGAPGDVPRFARLSHPTHAVITGVAAAHLDRYKTVHAAGQDIFSVTKQLKPAQVFVNDESPAAAEFIKKGYQRYDQHGALGWKVSSVRLNLDGMRFTLKKSKQTLELHTALIGRHHLGPLSLVAALADQFGLSAKQIQAGIAQTKPFEHRMQPYQLADAWIIDDTYNGNIEGIRAGTQLLKELPGKRKIYVTPGLVDQGVEKRSVHEEMGRLIAAAKPDIVVLMHNSVTAHIQAGLEAAHYHGELLIKNNPLEFYTNLNLFVAAGDLVLMQNDWTDNYS